MHHEDMEVIVMDSTRTVIIVRQSSIGRTIHIKDNALSFWSTHIVRVGNAEFTFFLTGSSLFFVAFRVKLPNGLTNDK